VSYGTSQGIEGSKDRINKTVVLHGQFLLGVTGFGELDGLPIDEWILEALNGGSPEIWPTKLAEQAARSIGRIRASAKRKHHTFAAVGFAPSSRGLSAPRHPLRLVISNAMDPQGARLDIAATRFTVTSHQQPEHKWADIAAYGQPPPETVLRDAERILRKYEDRNKGAAQGCVELLGRLVSGVSLRSPMVSSACLVSVLPKAAVGTGNIDIPVGTAAHVSEDAITCLNYIGTEDQRIAYMPATIFPGGSMAKEGFFAPSGTRPPMPFANRPQS
jgi:hypothetical protein